MLPLNLHDPSRVPWDLSPVPAFGIFLTGFREWLWPKKRVLHKKAWKGITPPAQPAFCIVRVLKGKWISARKVTFTSKNSKSCSRKKEPTGLLLYLYVPNPCHHFCGNWRRETKSTLPFGQKKDVPHLHHSHHSILPSRSRVLLKIKIKKKKSRKDKDIGRA